MEKDESGIRIIRNYVEKINPNSDKYGIFDKHGIFNIRIVEIKPKDGNTKKDVDYNPFVMLRQPGLRAQISAVQALYVPDKKPAKNPEIKKEIKDSKKDRVFCIGDKALSMNQGYV